MKRLVVCLCALVLSGSALLVSQATREVDITGYFNEKDGEYTRIVKNGDVYLYLSHLKAGDWVGVGIRDGDRLAIAWQRSDGKNLGVSHYRIETGAQGPSLVGNWTSLESNRLGPDRQTFARKLD